MRITILLLDIMWLIGKAMSCGAGVRSRVRQHVLTPTARPCASCARWLHVVPHRPLTRACAHKDTPLGQDAQRLHQRRVAD
jgi:hypothetical protein